MYRDSDLPSLTLGLLTRPSSRAVISFLGAGSRALRPALSQRARRSPARSCLLQISAPAFLDTRREAPESNPELLSRCGSAAWRRPCVRQLLLCRVTRDENPSLD